jgi:hypothetical protein
LWYRGVTEFLVELYVARTDAAALERNATRVHLAARS